MQIDNNKSKLKLEVCKKTSFFLFLIFFLEIKIAILFRYLKISQLKKLFFFIVIIISLLSCNKDENVVAPSIVGKWNFEKQIYTENTTIYPEENYPNEAGCNKNYIELTSSNTFKEIDYYSNCTYMAYNGNWTKSGNTISIIYSDTTTDSYEIVSVSETTLVIKHTENVGTNVFSYLYTLLRV